MGLVAVTTRPAYFDAAMDLLGSGAPLTLASLCSAVGVTSGSFYHHFGSWDGFVEGLMADWELRETTELIAGIQGIQEDAEHRLHLVVDLALTVPHRAESAIRSWANANATVAATQRRVDRARRAFLADIVAELPASGTSSPRILATLLLATFIGLEQLGDEVDPLEFVGVLTELRDRFTGVSGRASAPERAGPSPSPRGAARTG
jgi:AcrR family transcriptional regulator